ncbi:MAG: YggL family protein [Zoogloea sp.]|nr:YggL family protein [Zoogloea sp.]
MPRTWAERAPGLARQRSRRIRKKLKIGEFQELGFLFRTEISPSLASNEQLDLIERLIHEVLGPRGLQMGGGLQEAYVAKRSPGSASDADLSAVREWFGRQHEIESFDVGSLSDAWYGEP